MFNKSALKKKLFRFGENQMTKKTRKIKRYIFIILAMGLMVMINSCTNASDTSNNEKTVQVESTQKQAPSKNTEPSNSKELEKQKTEVPPSSEKMCTISNSNDTDKGGKLSSSGCGENEVCECISQGAHSCTGKCRSAH